MPVKARVFVSCGQQKGTEESDFASWIREFLIDKGYDPYVAIHEQTLSGLKENIFKQLAASDYILFVDFKREEIGNDSGFHRGSLYSHQELAIASYLSIPVLAFQQNSVKEQDGMSAALQLNPIKFERTSQLMGGLVANALSTINWSPFNRKVLTLELEGPIDLIVGNRYGIPLVEKGEIQGNTLRMYHLAVRNNSEREIALQCTGYLRRCIYENYEGNVVELDYRQAELKWAGIFESISNVNIFPGQTRYLDGVVINQNQPHLGHFNVLTDSTLYRPVCIGPGSFLLEYSVVSVNFPEVRCCTRITLGNDLEAAKMETIRCENLTVEPSDFLRIAMVNVSDS